MVNQDHDLTSQELEETLELLRDTGYTTGLHLDLYGLHEAERIRIRGEWLDIEHIPGGFIRHVLQHLIPRHEDYKPDNSWWKRWRYQDLLDYFVTLKRERNLRALLS